MNIMGHAKNDPAGASCASIYDTQAKDLSASQEKRKKSFNTAKKLSPADRS